MIDIILPLRGERGDTEGSLEPALLLAGPDASTADPAEFGTKIAPARLVELHGDDETGIPVDTGALLREINEFVDTTLATFRAKRLRDEDLDLDRVLATVLFTDIVGSTRTAAELGDRRWSELLDDHHARVRALLARYRGREIDTAGDGVLAAFDTPASAIRCAVAIVDAVRELGLEIRAGLHTGECSQSGQHLRGLTVHVGARVTALAGPSEVLVSGTVKDLVAGSGLSFVERGSQELPGVPGEWRLYAVKR